MKNWWVGPGVCQGKGEGQEQDGAESLLLEEVKLSVLHQAARRGTSPGGDG